jgi:putative transposase
LKIGGRPHFKGHRFFNSFEGKEAKSTIIWRDNTVRFAGMVLAAILDPADAWQAEALKAPNKYCRIIRREIRGSVRWYVQLVQEGFTPMRRETRDGVVGLDIGPGTVAIVGVEQGEAIHADLCPGIVHPWKAVRRLDRAMDRSRRATNPDCFNPDGTWKKGKKAKIKSRRYIQKRAERKERERRLRAERRRGQGELKNRILGVGTTVKTEANAYKAWQRSRFGKRMKVKAPAALIAVLRMCHACRLIEFPTREALSQFSHEDGTYTKKPLNQRYHEFSDGSRVQRDLYSAFLSCLVEGGRLDAKRAAAAWAEGGGNPLAQVGVGALLRAASSGIKTPSGRESWTFGQQGFRLPHVLPHMQKLRTGVRGVRSPNGVLKHGEASGVASARNGESRAGRAEAFARSRASGLAEVASHSVTPDNGR